MRRVRGLLTLLLVGALIARPAPLEGQRDVVRSGRGTSDDSVLAGALRFDAGRFTVVAYPNDERLARSVLQAATAADSFPGLPRPSASVLIAIAPDAPRFRAWAGPAAPEWGAAVAFPALQRVIMQGSRAGSDAGDPLVTLRHELAHLALYEALGDLPPRWFDEGYASVAAGEWGREEALAASIGLALRGTPSLDELELLFYRGAGDAEMAYALAHRAVADLMTLDPARGLTLFFQNWKATQSFEGAVRQSFGMTSLGFEQQWQRQTRRRYGALALLANLSLGFGVFAVVLGPFLWNRRRRDRRRLEALRVADAAQEAAQRASALEAMLAAGVPSGVAASLAEEVVAVLPQGRGEPEGPLDVSGAVVAADEVRDGGPAARVDSAPRGT
jgi:hypothetical protein